MTTNTDRIDLQLIDQLLKEYQKPEDVLGENGLLKQFTKAILERAMAAELTTHLGYEKHDPAGNNSGNSRNGKSKKILAGDLGELPVVRYVRVVQLGQCTLVEEKCSTPSIETLAYCCQY